MLETWSDQRVSEDTAPGQDFTLAAHWKLSHSSNPNQLVSVLGKLVSDRPSTKENHCPGTKAENKAQNFTKEHAQVFTAEIWKFSP